MIWKTIKLQRNAVIIYLIVFTDLFFIDFISDPGWNDPPMLNYNNTNPPPKSRITNKRVAFPLFPSNTTSQTTQEQKPETPPLPKSNEK